MVLKIYSPPPPLNIFVKSLIYYKGYTASDALEKLLPDGNSQLIIALDDNPRIATRETTDTHFTKAWITGIQTQPIVYQGEQNAQTLCIQFHPGGLYALTHIPSTEFHNQLIEASLVLNPATINHLREQLLACHTAAEIFSIACIFLKQRLFTFTPDNYLLTFTHLLLCEKNQPLAQVSRQTGYSQKHFIQLYKKMAGISPKKYQRLHRVNRAIELLQRKAQFSYSDISHLCHFYDQAHFINEFRYFTGFSPSQYLQLSLSYPHVVAYST
ncbi:AraC family transcriptional regulator [uncultured Microscilla sp.]|uniref:helix-turn-helix transcriptional regulator n=1 Tax=uncultured Microscilla sp. TaxID=432653 RepID=UPI002630558B|nr:AraC family transcriptional regulator [uncultured Microscilla sp.]